MRFRGDKRVRVALGFHPLRAGMASRLEEGQLVRLLAGASYVGEVGLDFSSQGKDSTDSQLRVFDRLLAEPELRHKVVTVHSRGAEAITIERLKRANVPAVLHWYTGPPKLIDEALAAGLYFSVNPAMLRTDKGRRLILALPAHRILTESDGPFAKARGHPTGPADMPWLVEQIASMRREETEEVRFYVHNNLAQLYAATVGAV
jgi:TatD DNase family protein